MISAEVLKAHLDAIDMQLQLALVQVKTLRHALEPLLAPKATPSLPARCNGRPPDSCGFQDDEARFSRASFASPHAWQCRGCNYISDLETSM